MRLRPLAWAVLVLLIRVHFVPTSTYALWLAAAFRGRPARLATSAETTLHNESSTLGDLDEAVSIMEHVIQRSQRVLGAAHPDTESSRRLLKALKTKRSSRA